MQTPFSQRPSLRFWVKHLAAQAESLKVNHSVAKDRTTHVTLRYRIEVNSGESFTATIFHFMLLSSTDSMSIFPEGRLNIIADILNMLINFDQLLRMNSPQKLYLEFNTRYRYYDLRTVVGVHIGQLLVTTWNVIMKCMKKLKDKVIRRF